MKSIVLGALLALLSVSAAEAIDCTKAATDLDHAICDNPDLLKADDALNAAYKAAIKAVGKDMARTLKADQVEWNGYRYEDCSTDDAGDPAKPEAIAQCLITDTGRRVSFLTGQPQEGPGIPEAALPQVIAGIDDVYDEYVRFPDPGSPGTKAFNAALAKELKDVRLAKTADQTTDYFQLVLVYASPTLLSASVEFEAEDGYAHPMPADYAINIDMQAGRVLTIADALDKAAIGKLQALCETQMADYISAGEEGADTRKDAVDVMVGDLDDWVFGADKATLRYTEYGMDSPATCELGYDVLRPLIKAGFPLPR